MDRKPIGIAGSILALLGAVVTLFEPLLLVFVLLLVVASVAFFLVPGTMAKVAGAVLAVAAFVDLFFFTPVTGDGGRVYLPDLSMIGTAGVVVASGFLPAAGVLLLRWSALPAAVAYASAAVLATGYVAFIALDHLFGEASLGVGLLAVVAVGSLLPSVWPSRRGPPA